MGGGGVLRDSITAADIPLAGLAAVAGYGSAPWAWSAEDWARFDRAGVPALSIVTRPGDIGDIADGESGDFTPAQAAAFVRNFNRPGRRAATLYCPRSPWPLYVGALLMAGLDPSRVDWWIATLDGTTDLFYGQPGVSPPASLHVVAIQWKGQAQTGGHYDESVILDPTWVTGTAPATPAQEDVDMIMLRPVDAAGNQNRNGVVWSGAIVLELLPDGTTEALTSQGVKTATVPEDFVVRLEAAAVALQGGRVVLSGALTATVTGELTPPAPGA